MLSLLKILIGTIIGFLLKTAYDLYKTKLDRKDKYMFALLNRRFEAYQEAYYICEQLKLIIHDKTDKKHKTISKAREWYCRNNLFLSPNIREDFRKLISDAGFYDVQLNDFYATKENLGSNARKTRGKREKLEETWHNIMGDIQKRLQEDIDKYYEFLK